MTNIEYLQAMELTVKYVLGFGIKFILFTFIGGAIFSRTIGRYIK